MFECLKHQLWGLEYSPFYVSVCFKTTESVDLDIFSLFKFVSEVLLYNLCFNVSKHQVWDLEFSPFYVSVFLETIESAGLDIFQPVSNCFSSFTIYTQTMF